MTNYVVLYVATACVFLAIDAVWLAFVAREFYTSHIGSIMLDRPRFAIAAVFYAVYVIGLVYFAVAPAAAGGGWSTALINGALFGFFAYLTYDATNLATIRGFSPVVAVVDTLWGTALSGVSALAGYTIARALGFVQV